MRLVQRVREMFKFYDDEYKLGEEIGEGGFGKVMKATNYKFGDTVFAVKTINADSDEVAVAKEIRMLLKVRGHPNIIRLLDVRKSNKLRRLSMLVFEFIPSGKYTIRYPHFNADDVRLYMYQLLDATKFMHSKSIVHRDIKPRNILIDESKRVLTLMDFGLAKEIFKGDSNSTHVGTLSYRSIEQLLGYKQYGEEVDIWAIGITMLCMIIPSIRNFIKIDVKGAKGSKSSKERIGMLTRISLMVGTEPIRRLAETLKVDCPPLRVQPERSLHDWIKDYIDNRFDIYKKVTSDAIDLISKLLTLNPRKRISAHKALRHPYFKSLSRKHKS